MKKKIYEVLLYDKYYFTTNKLAIVATCSEEAEEKLKNSNYDYHGFDIFQDIYDIDDVIV